jgi:hypothetical protein
MKGRATLILLVVFVLLATFLYFFEFKGGAKRKEHERNEGLIFKVPLDSIAAFSLSANNQDLTLKNIDGSWILTAPVTTDADSYAVISNLKAILETQIDRLIADSTTDLDQYGLDQPRGSVTLTRFDGREQKLLVGAENPTGEFIYVKFETGLPVYTVTQSLWNQVNKQPFDLRDKKIMHFKSPEVVELEIFTRNKGRVLLNREGVDWIISKPVQLKANSGEVESYLSRLTNGRVKEFIEESPTDIRRYGLQKPLITIHVSCKDEQAGTSLIVGDSLNGEETGFYAREKSRPALFTLEDWTVKNLNKGPFDFQEKKLITANGENITRIVVKRDEETSIVAQYDSAKWKLVNTDSLSFDENRLRRWVNAIRNYEVDELVSYKSEAVTKYGLEQPAIRIIPYQNDLELGQILIGKKAGDYFYTKSADQPYIYKVKASKVHEIEKDIKDFAVSES